MLQNIKTLRHGKQWTFATNATIAECRKVLKTIQMPEGYKLRIINLCLFVERAHYGWIINSYKDVGAIHAELTLLANSPKYMQRHISKL